MAYIRQKGKKRRIEESGNLQFPRDIVELGVSLSLQHTLKTTFMLWVVQRPPMRLCKSSLDEVLMK